MLRFLNQCSRSRRAWLLMTTITFGLEIVALWFQYIVGSKPCVFCIYERCALFGIIGAGLVGSIAPKTLLRYAAVAIWLYSSWKGIMLSWTHTMLQLYPSPFETCDFSVNFPSWLPLDKCFPKVFGASFSDCSSIHQRDFLTLEIPKWLIGIFVAYFIIAFLVLISQVFKPKKRGLFGR